MTDSNLVSEIKVEALNIAASTVNTSHTELSDRDVENQHPICAISELQEILDSKADIDNVPIALSQLTNDRGYALLGELPSKTSDLVNDSAFVTPAHSHNADNFNQISYADLTNTPSIPQKLSDLQNDLNFIDNTTKQNIQTVALNEVEFAYQTSVYKKNISADTTLTFDFSNITDANSVATFELWLDVANDSLEVTLPSMVWIGDEEDFSTAGLYVIAIRYDGTSTIANLSYKIVAQAQGDDGPEAEPAA